MKKLLCKLSLGGLLIAVSSTVLAAPDGFFMHAKLGWESTDYSTGDFNYMTSASFHKNGLSFSPSVGYQFNPNIAIEASYLDWQTDVDNIGLSSNPQGLSGLRNGSINNYSLDISAKGMLPLENGFGLFAKAGAAYVQSIMSGGMNNSTLGDDYHNTYTVRPITTFGASYELNDTTVLDIGQTHLYEGAGIPSANFTYLGIARYFG